LLYGLFLPASTPDSKPDDLPRGKPQKRQPGPVSFFGQPIDDHFYVIGAPGASLSVHLAHPLTTFTAPRGTEADHAQQTP